MGQYLTVAELKLRALVPPEYVDALEIASAGFIDAQLQLESAYIDSRLRKRYDAPFSSPYPVAVQRWLVARVQVTVYLRRGVDATDAQYIEIQKRYDKAESELEEAANAKDGLFDLPLRANTTTTGISKGSPRAYSESSPFVWKDQQACNGKREDAQGRGTRR